MTRVSRLAVLLIVGPVVLAGGALGCADAPAYAVGARARAAPEDEIAFAGMADVPARDEEAPAAASPPPAAGPDFFSPPAPGQQPGDARQVIYSAAFKVVVADVPGTLRSIREHAEQLGGHLQGVTGGTITVRVPAARFNDAVAFVERVGEVVDRQLSAQDVSEELRDLRIHLDNDERLRQRLQALLEKAEKVEDVLKIEAELTRVSEEIERAKGKLRFIESQVAMSSLKVELNAPVPQNREGTGPRLPFDWVDELGAGLVEGLVQQEVKQAGFFGRGPKFRPPAGFVRYYEEPGEVEAMNAEGLRLRVLRRDNVDKANLPFWSALARKTLVEERSLAVADERTDDDAYVLRGARDVGGKSIGYLLCVERSDRKVVAFEAWGSRELFDANLESLRRSALSIDP